MPKRYLLVCRGPDCKTQGSNDVREALREAMVCHRSKDAEGNDLAILPYTCLGLCGRGPNAVIFPDGIWFEALTPRDATDVVDCFVTGAIPNHLVATVTERHATEYFALIDELIPEIEAEEGPPSPVRKKRFLLF